jgi:hypothetical protein
MFELNGKSYSLDQLQKSAQKQGVDFNDFMSTMRSRGMVEKTAEPVFGRSDSISLFDNSQSTYGGTIEGVEEQKQKVINYRNTKKSIYEIGRGYFDALNTGWQTGTVLEEYLEVFKGNHSPEAIEAMVKAGDKLNKLPQNDRMAKYVKAVDDAGGGLWNGIIELANTDGALVASQVALQSLAMMVSGAVDSGVDLWHGKAPDVWGHMAAGAGVGAATFGALGTVAPGIGNLIGAGGGAVAGTMGGLSTALENGLTFVEMLKEEIEAEGGTYDKKSIAKFLSNDEKYKDIRNKALKRGLTIGAVDMLTGGIAGAVGVKTATKVGRTVLGPRVGNLAGMAVGTATEGIGGGVGEAAGQVAGGQEFSAADIILEAFAETPGALVTVGPKLLLNKPKYTITENTKEIEYTRDQFLEQIDGLNDESIAILDIKVDNDPALAEDLFNRQNDFVLDSRVDDRVSDPNDRAELVALEKERQKLEKQSKLTGLRKKPRAKEQLKNVEAQMEEIIDGYSGVDRRSSAVRKRKQTRKNVNEGRTKILMERIKKGVVESKAYQNMDISIDQVQSDTGSQMRLDQEEKNAMYDIGLLEAEKANIENDDTLPLEERVKELNQINAEIQAIEDGVNEVRNNMDEARDSHGFLLEDSESGKMKIVINEDKAIADGSGNINVAAHEFLHAVLSKSFNSKSNNYAVRSPRGLGGTVGGALFQYMKTLDSDIASNRFMARLLNYSGNEETMGQEVLNLMSDSLVDGSFNPNDTVLNKIGDMFATFFESVGLKEIKFGTAKDVYRFVKNFNKSIQGSKMAGRVVQKAAKQGEELFDTKPAENVSGKTESPMSKDVLADEEVVEDLGLKKETISIVAKNAAIEAVIIKENIRDKDGNVMASPKWQRALAQNNLPRAFALARQAAGKANDITLEEGLKMNDLMEWFSEYSLKLTELARTYRAVKDGKQVPFGAYMNSLLPKKYSGILDKLKSKIETSSMSNEATAKAVGKKSSSLNNMASTEVEGKTVALESIDQKKVQKELVRLVIENDTKLYKYKEVKSELTAHRKLMKDGTEITPELKAQYKKDGKKPPKELKSLREPIGRLYSGLEAVSEIFGKDLAIRIIKEQDLTTEQRKDVQDKILRYFPQVISMMPFGTTASGDATGVANTGLKEFYKKLSRTKMKDTGAGKGNYLQQKQYINPNIFKEMAGLVPGARVNNTSVDGFLRAVVVQVASIANNQAIRQAHGTEVIALKDGKASTMFSQKAKKKSKATTDNVEKGLTSKIQQKENGGWPSIAEIHEQVMVEMNTEFGRYELEQWLFEGNGKEYLTKAFLTNSGNFTGTTKRSVDANGNKVRLHTRNLLYRNVKELNEKVELELNKQALIQHKVEFDKLNTEQKASIEKTVFPADSKYNAQELEDIANVFKKITQNDKNFADTESKESKARGFELLWRAFDQMIEDNPANGRYILALLSSSSSQQRAFMRTGSIFGFTNTLDEASIEEHTLAASDFAKFLFNRLMERNLFGDLNFFDKAVQSYFQGPLPLRMDDNLVGPGFTYKDNAGKYSWDVFMGLKPIWIRYINPDVNGNNGGVDPNVIILSNGNTLAEEFGVGVPAALRTPTVIAKQQQLLFNIFNEVNIEKRNKLITTAGKAINNFANVKLKGDVNVSTKLAKAKSLMSKGSKGISVLDFDDTLATTKSGVRAKIPNPDGTPKPGRKVIFLAGGAGSGKGNVISKLGLKDQGFKIVNSDISLEWLKKNSGLPENMNDFTKEQRSKLGSLQHQARGIARRKMMKYQGDGGGVVVDGTGGSIKSMEKLVNEFKGKGYDVSMVFTETSLDVALERNAARKERSLLDKIVTKNHEAVQGNKDGFKTMFGDRFMEVNTNKLSQEDAMPNKLVKKMDDFVSGYENRRLDAEEFANEGADILEQGGTFDFSEFNEVVEGQTAPLFEKAMKLQGKFGNKDMFVLTARPAESAPAIFEFLQANGLNIPLENITGLANSTPESKALWIADKVADGYNDFYFADDALQNVQAVQNMLDQFDVKSKVQQAKVNFSKGDPQVVKLLEESSKNDVKSVDGLANPGTYSNVKFSKAHRGEYEKTISKNRPDLVKEDLVSKTVDNMFVFIDNLDVPTDKKRKYERITTKWLATSNVKLSEDGYKVKQAVEIAEKHNEDIFSYRNPNEIIEKYAGKTKAKPTNPESVKEFRFSGSNKEKGITTYEVENTVEGQKAVRDVIDTHWGKDSNPWCITQVKDGKLTDDAWHNWTVYDKSPKRIIFHNGKLSSFYADNQYWDRMDSPTDAPVVQIKEGNVTRKVELVPYNEGGVTKIEEFVRETRTVSKDKKTVTTEILVQSEHGYEVGTEIVENRVNGITVKSTRSLPGFISGKMRVQEIINFDKKGKATNNITFTGSKPGVPTAINRYGMPFGEMSVKDIIMTKGDLLSHEMSEGGFNYFHGEVKMNNQVTGKPQTTEIGWKTPEKMGDLRDFVTTSPNGEIRADFKKILEVDPGAHGIPSERGYTPVTTMFSKGLSQNFNDILENVTGIESKKRFSAIKARKRGSDKGKFRFFIPPSHEDFVGLLYNFLGKGKEGNAQMRFFEDALIKPLNRAYRELDVAKQAIANDYKSLNKEFPDVKARFKEKTADGDFTYQDAIRVYLWNKHGHKAPGLSVTDQQNLVDIVTENSELQVYAETLNVISKQETYVSPREGWEGGDIRIDLVDATGRVGRAQYFAEFQENADLMFDEDNMNKIEAAYGASFRSALEDMLHRIKTGVNRPKGQSATVNKFMNYLNGSVGAVMFLNMRSAALQQMSIVNYINFADNNIASAALAFANQPQYWKDFAYIYNSDMLKQRRGGIGQDINGAELAEAVSKSRNPIGTVIGKMLKLGFTPTQIGDSLAISIGGSTFYRNRINKYIKDGLSPKEAEAAAWTDFDELTQSTQQSARPDKTSQQQASWIGKLILNFQNITSQYNRVIKKAGSDIINRRITSPNTTQMQSDMSNASRILYYGAIQNLVFYSLQTALFALTFGTDDEDEDKKAEQFLKKKERVINGTIDSLLRGSGIYGALVSTMKNMAIKWHEQREKKYNPDESAVIMEMLNFSPVVGIKARKMVNAEKTLNYNKKVIKEMETFDIDNPMWSAVTNYIEATTNVPVNRLYQKTINVRNALDNQYTAFQRAMFLWGYTTWSLNLGDTEKMKDVKEKVKSKKKKKKTKNKKTRSIFDNNKSLF